MNKVKAILAIFVAVCVVLAACPAGNLRASAAGGVPVATGSNSWPKVFERNGAHIVVYQPQLKSWRGYRSLVADTAVAITQSGGQPILGVISWSADTLADVAARTVYIANVKVLSSRFPSLDPAQEAALQQKVSQLYPTMTFSIGLDRMIASLQHVNDPVHSISVDPQAPKILVSMSPAIVLFVDGKPVLAPIPGTNLQYVVNTSWDLFYDGSNYYLLSGKTWLKSKQMTDPWIVTLKIPPEMAKLPANQNWGDVLKAVPPPDVSAPAPKVLFTDKPAELILFRGRPAYARIPGTSLQYATNSDSSIFLHLPDNQVYVLLSGRWFRAANLEGPWAYAGNDLPPDFALIPAGKPYSTALISVPGTQAASDAVLLAQVPTTAIVNRAQAEAQVKVVYAGDPVFVPVESTTMFYAVNTSARVIRVGSAYYLCYQGIWFVSLSPAGPWKTADSVPQVIYTIPPSSPVYNVTYVVVSNPTPTTVEMSYSSGYMGMFVLGMAVGATLVYGTGYYYPPYVYWGPHPIYYPYPYTYGCAAYYNPYTGGYAVGRAVYGPYGSAGSAAWYNPATGMYGRAVTTQNAYGGHTYAQAYNPWTGTYAATSQGHNQYSQWGNTVVTNGDNWAEAHHVTNSQGTAGSFQTSKGSEGAGFSGANGNSGFVAKDANNNNVYAGADGNVYKKDSDGNWSKWDNGSWTPVTPPSNVTQAKNDAQNKANQKNQNPGSSSPGASSSDSNRPAQRSGSQTPPSRSTPNSPPSGSSDTMNQLQNDADGRSRGDQLEQSRNAGRGAGRGAGSGAASGGGGGRRRP